jgi:hypothetical protein
MGLTAAITTYERPACVAALITSLRTQYPYVGVVVSDTSARPLFADDTWVDRGLRWIVPKVSSGHAVGASRNHLLDHIETPFLLLCDDDHEVVEETDVRRMLLFLRRHSEFDIVAGAQGRRGYGAAVISEADGVATVSFYRHRGFVEPGVVRCDRVENTFVARRDSLRRVRWDPTLLGTEHDEFFVRAKRAGLLIAQMGGTHVEHRRDCEVATSIASRVAGRFVRIHIDRVYRRSQVGATASQQQRSMEARQADRIALAALGLHRIRRVRRPALGWLFRRTLFH